MAVIAERGVTGMSFAEIGSVSGYSRGIGSHYFGTKENLLVCLLRDVGEQFNAALRTAAFVEAKGLDQLVNYIELYFERAKSRPQVARALQLMRAESLTAAPPFQQAVKEANLAAFESIREMLLTARDDGSVRKDVDIDAHAGLIVGGLRGIVGQYLADPHGFDMDATGQAFIASIRRSIAGSDQA